MSNRTKELGSIEMTPEQKKLETMLLDYIEKESKAERENGETISRTALALIELWRLTDHCLC